MQKIELTMKEFKAICKSHAESNQVIKAISGDCMLVSMLATQDILVKHIKKIENAKPKRSTKRK